MLDIVLKIYVTLQYNSLQCTGYFELFLLLRIRISYLLSPEIKRTHRFQDTNLYVGTLNSGTIYLTLNSRKHLVLNKATYLSDSKHTHSLHLYMFKSKNNEIN